MAWSRPFDDPIELPDGQLLQTLADSGHYATVLPKAVQEQVEWQTAAEMLILAARGKRLVMFAYIAMRRALHATRLGAQCSALGAYTHRQTRQVSAEALP